MDSSGAAVEVSTDPGRDRILRSAHRLFLESGFEGTSVGSIARASGMTSAALYWHFTSKVDILFAVLQSMLRDGYQELERTVVASDPATRLAEYVAAFVEQQMEESGSRNFGYASLVASLPAALQTELWQLGRPYMDLLREILSAGQKDGSFAVSDLVVTAFAIGTTCEYVFTWYRPDGPLSKDIVIKQYVNLVLRMVTQPSAR